MKLKEFRIENFRSHKKGVRVELDFFVASVDKSDFDTKEMVCL